MIKEAMHVQVIVNQKITKANKSLLKNLPNEVR